MNRFAQTSGSVSTVTLGDVEIARMGLGTNRLTKTAENIEFIKAAVEAGVQMIDTAHLYTGGESEQTIGAALSSKPSNVIVATKGGFGHEGGGRPEVVRSELEQSLRSLATDKIDLYYLHRIDPETAMEESLGPIKEYRDKGAVRHVGISNVTVAEIERARKVVPITAVQNRYNVVAREFDDVVDYCEREGIVFVAYHPVRDQPPAAVDEIARRHDATRSQVALAWLLKRSPAILPIPGTLSIAHLKENLRALEIELSDEEFEALN